MKFVIATQEFNFLLNKCLNVVAAKATIPILANVLIEAVNGELIITATDLTVGVRCVTEARILQEGATTLPARKLAQLIRELTAVNLEVTTNQNEITEIVANSSRFKIHGMSRAEFPALPNLSEGMHFTIEQKDLKEMLYRTSFAVSKEDTRYVLTGVCMQISNGEATFIGTDGKRLAKAQMPIKVEKNISGSYVIPLKTVEEILKNLSEEGEVVLHLTSDKIAIETNDTTIISKLLTGDYPDVNRVIPQQFASMVSIHRDELMTLLRQVSLFTTETNHSVRFAFNNGELNLTANTNELGEGKVSMPVNYQGQPIEIAFNPNFFLDILRHSKQETVNLGVTDAFNPGVITDSAHALCMLMPMRLNEE